MRIKSVLSHSTQAVAEGALISLLAVGLMVGTTFAAKGGQNATSTSGLTLVMVTDGNADGLPNHGDVVTFDISTTATTQPFVNLQCYQNGAQVLNAWNGFFVGSFNTNDNFGLSSAAWQSGAADCTAWLDKSTKRGWSTLGSMSFHVGA